METNKRELATYREKTRELSLVVYSYTTIIKKWVTTTKKLFKYMTLLCLVFSFNCFSYEPVNKNLSHNAEIIFNYFQNIYKTKTLAGYNVYPHTPDIYEQTGKHGAIWARDLKWFGDVEKNIKHVKDNGYILSIHWHWFFNNESAWIKKRKIPVDISKMITGGTPENIQMFLELAKVADTLERFRDAGVPILWRPLHETDGDWFWWSDIKNPENTVKLWHIMYDYMTNQRQLNNLIWVYSASIKQQTIAKRKTFYPGSDYVDISGIDIYHVDIKKDKDKYNNYHKIMTEVSPGKMLALGEADAIPNPNFYNDSNNHRWLYVLPWWGTPHSKRPINWAIKTMSHEDIVTLDELPILIEQDLKPNIGITHPIDKGSTWFTQPQPTILVEANDRGGSITTVALYANKKLIEEQKKTPFSFTLDNVKSGSYLLYAVATDDTGNKATSNTVRIVLNKGDIAKNKDVFVSSGKGGSNVVDGDVTTYWTAEKSDNEWLYIDLEDQYLIDNINLYWGWKIHPQEFIIEIATSSPEISNSWSIIHTETNIPYTQWKLSHQINFPKKNARYIKFSLKDRAGKQFWGGFRLTTVEIPIDLAKMPALSQQIKKKMQKTLNNIPNTYVISLTIALLLLLAIYIKFKNHATRKKMDR